MSIYQQQFELAIGSKFHLIDVPEAKELVYGARIHLPKHKELQLTMRIYSSITKIDGVSRPKDEDAIRVLVLQRVDGVMKRVGRIPRRVYRLANWRNNLDKAIASMLHLEHICAYRHTKWVMCERMGKKTKFWGCPMFPKCKNVVWPPHPFDVPASWSPNFDPLIATM